MLLFINSNTTAMNGDNYNYDETIYDNISTQELGTYNDYTSNATDGDLPF